jgi:CDP-glucose 4,6-dehydratase
VQNQASNEIREQFLAAEKARRVLGWRPAFTLDQGLERTVAWYRSHLAEAS